MAENLLKSPGENIKDDTESIIKKDPRHYRHGPNTFIRLDAAFLKFKNMH